MEKHREFVLAGSRMKQHLSSEHTGGILSLFENMSSEASNTPIHVHANEDETLYIIRGEIRAILGGREEVLKAGNTIFLPRGIPHQLVNESGAPAKYLLLCTPGGFECFLEEAGHSIIPGVPIQPSTATDVERLKAAARRFGITLLASWPR